MKYRYWCDGFKRISGPTADRRGINEGNSYSPIGEAENILKTFGRVRPWAVCPPDDQSKAADPIVDEQVTSGRRKTNRK